MSKKKLSPFWLARAVFALAAETGWSEDFILRRLPWVRFLMYRHAQLFDADCWTVEPDTETSDKLADRADRLISWNPDARIYQA